jgi:hypothetical protein
MKLFIWGHSNNTTVFLTARLTFKRLLSFLFISQQIMLKIGDQKREKCHTGGGGGQKSAKKCHVLFKWPLLSKTIEIDIA